MIANPNAPTGVALQERNGLIPRIRRVAATLPLSLDPPDVK